MTQVAAVLAVLQGDTTLTDAATGGIHDWEDSLGLSRRNTPSAFVTATGVIKPCIVVRSVDEIPDGMLADDAAQMVSVREMVQLWFYQDRGFDVIDTMKSRAYTLLHAKRLTGTHHVTWQGDRRIPRDVELDANGTRSDYLIRLIRTG